MVIFHCYVSSPEGILHGVLGSSHGPVESHGGSSMISPGTGQCRGCGLWGSISAVGTTWARRTSMDHSMCAGRLIMTPEIARFDYDSGFQELKVPQFHPIPTGTVDDWWYWHYIDDLHQSANVFGMACTKQHTTVVYHLLEPHVLWGIPWDLPNPLCLRQPHCEDVATVDTMYDKYDIPYDTIWPLALQKGLALGLSENRVYPQL